jgi:hypothetical protein
MSLAMVGGLFAAALGTSASAATVKEWDTEFDVLKYSDGKFVGRLAGKRFLCLQDQKVVIMKKGLSGADKLMVADLNIGPTVWQNFGEAKFASAKHPALSITNKRKRNRALRGEYFAKYVGGPVADYGKAGLCLPSKSETIEISI